MAGLNDARHHSLRGYVSFDLGHFPPRVGPWCPCGRDGPNFGLQRLELVGAGSAAPSVESGFPCVSSDLFVIAVSTAAVPLRS